MARPLFVTRKYQALPAAPLTAKKDEPGPLLIQGDHGPVEYRNIILTPAR